MSLGLITHLTRDPRHGQIAAVGALVLAGAVWFGFEMPWWRPVAALGAALAMQWIACRAIRLPFDWRSRVIFRALRYHGVASLLRSFGPAVAPFLTRLMRARYS